MAHIPHLYFPRPWGTDIALSPGQKDHLARVLRRADGSEVSYTDGAGAVGTGTLQTDFVVRGSEGEVSRPHPVRRLAVAPLRSKDRNRMIVEKSAELGVDELIWLRSRFGQAPPPSSAKARSWAIGALEQSRGAWLMQISGPREIGSLQGQLLIAEQIGAGSVPEGLDSYTILVGPEGGFTDAELPAEAPRVSFSDRTLRTDTVAVLAAGLVLK